MATTPQLLKLSKMIAQKARQLIPRSSNRVIFGAADASDNAQASRWDPAPEYVRLQNLAQRSRKSQNEYRKLIARHNTDIAMHSAETEDFNNDLFKSLLETDLVGAPLKTIAAVRAALQSAERATKTHHKNAQAMEPMERHEANAKNAVRYRVGNCGENASLALVMFAEYPGPPDHDNTLPTLDGDATQRPLIEKIEAIKPADHAFVVVNRPPVDIKDTNAWMMANVIICDPWWFHSGDAFLATDRVGEKQQLLEFIESWSAELRVNSTIRLGGGHSARYTGKYSQLNYYSNPVNDIVEFLKLQ